MRSISVLILLIQFSSLRCQEPVQKNNFVFLEGLGSAGYYSLNYEKTLFRSPYARTYIRAGLGITYDTWIRDIFPDKPKTFFLTYNIPLMLGTEVGSKPLKYEYGLGADFTVGENTRHYNMLTAGKNSKYATTVIGLVGLRYSCRKNPMFFKLSYTPLYEPLTKTWVLYWIGASVGYAF